MVRNVNKDFVKDLVDIAKRYTKSNFGEVLVQTYTSPFSVFVAIEGHIGTRNIEKFRTAFKELKAKYERNDKMYK
jgi:hypothetical protein